MLIYKKIIIAACLLLPVSLSAQNTEKEDILQGMFLETVVINSYNTHPDFYGHHYDGQARTEHLLDNIPPATIFSILNYENLDVIKLPRQGRNFIIHATYNF